MDSNKTANADAPDNCQLSIVNCQLLLKRYWGYDSFRGIQQDIIESILSGHDTLGLMPTGGGKSICFQVPALAMKGVCIVITPLIALMKDQVYNLRRRGIMAAAIYSGMQHDDILRTLDNCILGSTKLLYVSPERLGSDLFVTKLRHMRVSFITVDEAHCISQWGYDFRPAYLQIATIRALLPDAPVLALTATATPQVVDDICHKLSTLHDSPSTLHESPSTLHDSFRIFRMSFERKNLSYVVRKSNNKDQELIHTLQHTTGSAIVYVHSRRHAKELATLLTQSGLSATFYHAGLEHAVKDQRQSDWQHDRTRIIVATNAFGMGIDKPDVRLVLHYDCPDSIEAYFQEAGRAGRDGLPAQAIALYNTRDDAILTRRIENTFPPRDYIRQVYEHLAYYYQLATGDGYGVCRQFDIEQFCQRFHHFPVRVHAALQILQRAGYIDYDESPDQQTRIHMLLERHELYRLHDTSPQEERVLVTLLRNYGGLFADFVYIDDNDVARQCNLTLSDLHQVLLSLGRQRVLRYIPASNVPTIRYTQRREDAEHVVLPPSVYEERLQQFRARIEAMVGYLRNGDRCRSRQLLEYFGETATHNCGHCDVCANPSADVSAADVRQAILQLLADGRPHPADAVRSLPFSTDAVKTALGLLIQEETILQQDGLISLH